MTASAEGFQIPRIDESRCTNCGLCSLRCPQNAKPGFRSHSVIKALGARLKNDTLLSKSASGGFFAGVAAKILETEGNAVFGCAFDQEMVARHICVTDAGKIEPLQSSKYVQSDVGDTYLQAKDLLQAGKTVLYSGTPCQIAGLYSYVGGNYDNLFTMDLICHGVPSPLLFKRYIEWLEKKYGEKTLYYDFRCKEKSGYALKLRTETKTKFNIAHRDPYYRSFIENHTLRECCYNCHYANTQRMGDLTIGDYWGIENIHPEFYDKRGVSVILVNTEQGQRLLRAFGDQFDVIESALGKAVMENGNLHRPSPRSAQREAAYKDINNNNLDIFKQRAYKIDFLMATKMTVKRVVKRVLPQSVIQGYKALKRRHSQDKSQSN
jgi:coenzyme F420-reducing hydrogenase beta subunit